MQLLELLFAVLLHVLGHAVLHGLLQGVDAVAAGVADAYLGILGHLLTLLGELLAALFGEGRYAETDDFAVVLGGDAYGRVDDGLLDDAEHVLVPRLDGDGACIGGSDRGYTGQGYHGSVRVYTDAVEDTGVGFAGTDAGEFVFYVEDGHLHHLLCFVQVFLHNILVF